MTSPVAATIRARFRQALSNEELPIEVRVRMACAFGAVMGALALSGDVFAAVPAPELGDMLRSAVHALLAQPGDQLFT